jgi:hypothetical protein
MPPRLGYSLVTQVDPGARQDLSAIPIIDVMHWQLSLVRDHFEPAPASMMLTVDGVYQGPGGPDEDRRGGFERGGWTAAYADPEVWAFVTASLERGRLPARSKTWEIREPYWPLHESGDPVSHRINVRPSTTSTARQSAARGAAVDKLERCAESRGQGALTGANGGR